MAPRPVGIIANPASGKDIRRLVARASVFDNQEKQNIVRRVIVGAVAGGASRFYYLPDAHGIVAEAIAEHRDAGGEFLPVEYADTQTAYDTIVAAREMRARDCGAVITLGGDGTNRAVALGWLDVPLVSISTGTNNVFPRMMEATVAGAAAGLVASGGVRLDEVERRAKVVHATIDGERDDIALIDAVWLDEHFVGARAIWDARTLRFALLTRAEPASVGISSIGGLIRPVSDQDDHALLVEFGPGQSVRAPIAPGLYQDVPVSGCRTAALGETITLEGPGVLAFDGERERVLQRGQRAQLRVVRDGPRVVDVERTLQLAACRGLFRSGLSEGSNGD